MCFQIVQNLDEQLTTTLKSMLIPSARCIISGTGGSFLKVNRQAMSTVVQNPLSDEEVKNYGERGFVIPKWKLPAADLERGRIALENMLRNNPGVLPELLVNSHIAEDAGKPPSSSTKGSVQGDQTFLDLASSPALVDMVAQVLGTENVILWACQVS